MGREAQVRKFYFRLVWFEMPVSHSSDNRVYEFGAQWESWAHGPMFGTQCSTHNISSNVNGWDYIGTIFREVM